MNTKDIFPNWLQGQLDALGWSQADLARKARISKSVISRALSGDRIPDNTSLVAIARALGLPVVTVFVKAGVIDLGPAFDEEQAELNETWTKLEPAR